MSAAQTQSLFSRLWQQYTELTPSAQKIHDLFQNAGEPNIINDHIAFRTFDDARVNIDVLKQPFIKLGYEEKGEYVFTDKKLFAKHYEHPTDKTLPKIFISQLESNKLSATVQQMVKACVDAIPASELNADDLLLKGRLWGTPNYALYEKLSAESEYAAWMYVYGFCPNHFTVFVNYLKHFETLESVNNFLKEKGYKLNVSGGEIKGSPGELLEQSSTLAEQRDIQFEEGVFKIPSVYYEFARRYEDEKGELYHGFIAASADKIFESTDRKLAQ
ncbi:MAG TPA: DUF1338 domain-containing protein [Chitinophagales bacterium]